MVNDPHIREGGTVVLPRDEELVPSAAPAVDMLSCLSHDLAEKVLMHVGEGPALAAASQVCHRWHELATTNSVWSHQYHRQYPHSDISSSIISVSTATSIHLSSPTHAPAHSRQPADPASSTSCSVYDHPSENCPHVSFSPRNGLYSHRQGGSSRREGHHSSPAAATEAKGPQHTDSRDGQVLGPPELGPRTLASPEGHASWREAYVWKLRLDAAWRRRKPWPLAALQEHRAWLSCVRLLPASQRLVSGGLDDQLCIWHTDGSLEHALRLDSSCTCLDVCGQQVVSGGVAGEVNLWDVNTGAVRGRWAATGTGRATSMQLLGDQQLLAAHGKSPLRLWDLRTTLSGSTSGSAGPDLNATAPASTGQGTGTAVPQPAMQFTINAQGAPRAPGMRPTTVELRRAALDPHTQLMVVSDQSGSLHVFDIRMGGTRALTRVQAYDPDQREGGSPDITSMALSRSRLAIGSAGGLIKVWDLHALSRATPGQDYSRYSLYDSEDEEAVARYGAGSSTGAGCLQSVAAGEECPLLSVGVGHTSLVLSLAWGEEWQLASASYDGTAAVWDTTGLRVRSGQAPHALHHPMAWVPSLDQPLPLGPDTAPADEPGAGATNAIILRPDFPDGTSAVGRRQMLARSRLPARHRGCAVHAIDIASEPGPSDCVQLVVGGQDATVRLYSVMPEGRRSQLGAKGDREDGGALWASG